jgi:hypothetical protein
MEEKELTSNETQEMVGILLAISIVSKRLARRLSKPDEDEEKEKT